MFPPEVEAWFEELRGQGIPVNPDAHINQFGSQVSKLYCEEAWEYFGKEYPDTEEGTMREWTHVGSSSGEEVYYLYRYYKLPDPPAAP